MLTQRTKLTVIVAGTVSLLFAMQAWSCTYSSTPRRLARDFVVRVTSDGEPVRGLIVALSTDPDGDAESQIIERKQTDSDGRAEFKKVRRGRYFVGVDHPAIERSISVEVVRRPPARGRDLVEIDWPGFVVRTRSLAGQIEAPLNSGSFILDMAKPQYRLLERAQLELSEAVSNQVIASEFTNSDGKFEFKDLRPGLYILHISRPGDDHFWEVEGHIPIMIDPETSTLVVRMQLWKICGETVARNLYEN